VVNARGLVIDEDRLILVIVLDDMGRHHGLDDTDEIRNLIVCPEITVIVRTLVYALAN
jgi:hypothetical protein